MTNRMWWMLGFGGALAVPYFALDGNLPPVIQQARQQWASTGSPAYAPLTGPTSDSSESFAITPIVPLAEILRWEWTPQLVFSRWPRVAVVEADPHLRGLRVPVITGSQPYDVVGSLTYYFDAQQTCRRIALEGTTLNEAALLSMVTASVQLSQVPIPSGLLLADRATEPTNLLYVAQPPLVDAGAPVPKVVWLEFNRRDNGARLSMESRERWAQWTALAMPGR